MGGTISKAQGGSFQDGMLAAGIGAAAGAAGKFVGRAVSNKQLPTAAGTNSSSNRGLSAQAAVMQSEGDVLEEMIVVAKRGGLGFSLPVGWSYSNQTTKGRSCTTTGLLACVETEEAGNVRALTSRSANHTDFYKGTASAPPGAIELPSVSADGTDSFAVLAVDLSDPHEMAAFTIGHEVLGHLIRGAPGWTIEGESAANAAGWDAVKAFRKYRATQ
jgi:hypothetical protein